MEEHKEDLKEVKIVVLEEQQEEHDDKTTELHRKKEKYARVDGHGKGVEDVQMEELREEGDCVEIDRHEYNGKDAEMAELQNADEELDSVSSGTFVDDFGSGEISSDNDDETNYEAPLTDAEIEELVAEFLEVESKAADAQEALEKESLSKVESDVRLELAETLHGDALEIAVSTEMDTFRENWEVVLVDLETQSALLLEQLDGAGIELPGLYKWIESQVPNGCCTEAWKKRAHWVGSQVTTELNQSVRDAEVYLQSCRPVRRKKGKMLEEGASGYLAKKLPIVNGSNLSEDYEEDWKSFFNLIQPHSSSEGTSFGSKNWESVYLASTPQQAANLGIKLPGVDEVEEIDETNGDPFYADAIANEKETDLSEEQKNNFRKVREEDDVNITRKLQQHLKRRRQRNGKHEPVGKEVLDGMMDSKESDIGENSVQISNSDILLSENIKTENPFVNGTCKRSHDEEDVESSNKKCRTVVIESDDEVNVVEKSTSNVSSRDKDSPSWDKKVIDIIDVDTLPSPCSQVLHTKDKAEEFHCTACYGVLKVYEVEKHPILEVIVCKSCKFLVAEKKRLGDHASGSYCAWCGKNIDLIRCSSCEMSFCAICLTRNFGLEHLPEAKAPGWQCCCCLPSLLHRSTLECERALGVLPVARHESDPDISDAEIDATISEQKRPKKRTIRRILDDAELGDETKQKIALEKARQEYLKSMQEQSDGKYLVTDIATVNGNSTVGVADGTGEIVNIAREEDEEQIRIPQSISSKLKPHQIAGIRFMWENVIQSVGKVKSGDKGLGCILAHTMGLGKTFQVIAFLYTALRGVNIGLRTALVVTPVNVLHNWRREFEKWRPSEYKRLRVLMLEDVARERRAELLAKWKSKGGVLLIGYATFRNLCLGKHVKDKNTANEICHALQYGPDVLVCDEAHMIKNTKADITQALKQVKTQRRIALTGSPLQNNLMEYFCMVDFVREGYLGSSHEFRNRFQNPIENGQHTNSTKEDVKIMNQRSHILYEQLKGFVQRMDMNVVKKDLPSKTVYVITVKLSPLQKKLYKKFLYAHGFANDKVSSDKRRSSFFMGYQALAQIWNHPGLLQMAKEHRYHQRREDAVENFLGDESSGDDNVEYTEVLNGEKQRTKTELMVKKSDSILCHEESDWWEDLLDEKIYNDADYSGKMVLLLDILAMSSGIGDKALVFSQSLTTLDLIEKLLSKLPREGRECKYWKQGKDWYRLDGSTDGLERQKLVERFNEPTNTRVKCTLISTRAGSLGINLHAANRVIVIDGSWNPTYDLQAIYRVWRYGQTKPVYAYRLMAHGTMEEKIYKRQVTKEGLAARVVDRQQIHRTMSKEEILHLFDFGDDENADMTDKVEEDPVSSEQQTTVGVGHLERSSFILSQGTSSSDKIMENLLSKHYPRWIANYHEHETLLQENEADRLSKEEQDMAWQTYQRSLVEWEEVQRTVIADDVRKPVVNVALPESNVPQQAKSSSRSHPVQRKCTNLAHLLTLRSQGTKSGGTTVCGECSQEISWESLNRDGKSR